MICVMPITDPQLQMAVLFASTPDVDTICRLLGETVERRQGRHDLPDEPAHSLLTREGGRGLQVDLFDHRWHDSSGEDAGPGSPTYSHSPTHDTLQSPPGSLKRAIQQHRGADDAAVLAANHSAYVLLRPANHAPPDRLARFNLLMDAAIQLLSHKAASCVFNPMGEVLICRNRLEHSLNRYRERELPPIELLSNARFFEVGAGWAMADSVGLQQLGLPDQEVVFHPGHLPPDEAMHFARNLAMHFVQHRPEVSQGETAGGPGDSIWEALPLGQGAIAPERPVIRWLPESREGMPKGLEIP